MTLHEKTIELYHNRPRNMTIKVIIENTNITKHWLSCFISGTIKEPSVNKVEELYTFLNGKGLDL